MENNMEDLAIPEIKLIQNVGGDEAKAFGAKPGDFYCAITQGIIDGAEGFEVVVMKSAQKTRTYWGREEIEDEPPICASIDGITSINGDICATACPYNAFTDAPYMVSAAERRAKCLPNYNVMAIKIDDMMPMMIRCSGISAMAARELNALLKFHKVVRKDPFKAKLRVTAVKKKTASGEAFAIKFGEPSLIEELDILAEVKEIAEAVMGVAIPIQNLAITEVKVIAPITKTVVATGTTTPPLYAPEPTPGIVEPKPESDSTAATLPEPLPKVMF